MRLFKTLITAGLAAALLVVPASALAKRSDRDHDRMPDKWERQHHLNTRANDARKDPDKDGLSNLSEFRHNTDPRNADTDEDGVNDQNEIEDNTNPRSDDSDRDGVDDADEVSGTVTSFDNGVLTIQLAADGAGTVSGTVGDATHIECSGDSSTATATASSDGHDGSDDNSGPGSDSSGSGSGDGTTPTTSGSDDGANHDAGDDNGGDNTCTSADLKPGARVHEAKLASNTDGSKVFTKIELVPAA